MRRVRCLYCACQAPCPDSCTVHVRLIGSSRDDTRKMSTVLVLCMSGVMSGFVYGACAAHRFIAKRYTENVFLMCVFR